MSERAERERLVKRHWARPGGFHDWLVRGLKILLPAGVGVLLAYMFLSPLSREKEISFLLDKNKVDVARERLKVQSAQYRGVDNRGRPFTIDAARAVQARSSDPVVEISGMAARIELEDGPASLRAERGRYNLETQKVEVIGPIRVEAADGYRLDTRDVTVDLHSRTLTSDGGVEGRMPLGRFSGGSLTVDLPSRRAVVGGRARLHIVQGGLRGAP
jgi:lipopolysaccharide export system protein LptC